MLSASRRLPSSPTAGEPRHRLLSLRLVSAPSRCHVQRHLTPLVRAGSREQPCHCARPSCRAVVSNRVCRPRRLHPHELGHTTLPCAGESLFGAAHRHRPLSAACRCEIAAVPTVVRARVLLAASACSCAMGRHAKSWAVRASVHAGLHGLVQPTASVLRSWARADSARCLLKRFLFSGYFQILANFKNLYKFDLKSEKYETNFIEYILICYRV
jgi:hypothetical protein